MAWQRTGCSHDGGSNVLGQMPLDYGQISPRGGGGDTTFQRGGGGYTSPREYARAENQTDRRQPPGSDYGREQSREQENEQNDEYEKVIPKEARGLKERYNVKESLGIIVDTMSQRKDRSGKKPKSFGLKELRRKFQLFDDTKEASDEGKALLNWEEFYTGIEQQQGFIRDEKRKLNRREIFEIFYYCDVDRSGNLDLSEFLANIINTALPPSCKANVDVVFTTLDIDGSGFIEVGEIKRHYNVAQHPEVQNGKKSEAEAFADYVNAFEPDFLYAKRTENTKDNRISHEEWMDYYCGIYREYLAAYGKAAVNAFNTLIKSSYKNFGKGTRDAFKKHHDGTDVVSYKERNEMKGTAFQY